MRSIALDSSPRPPSPSARGVPVWVALLVAAGCAVSSPVGDPCESGSECESGACNQGKCVDPDEPGGGGAGAGGASSSTSTSTSASTSGSGSGGGGLCQPNHDGTITRDEVPIEVGLSAKFLAATDATVSTAGTMQNGTRTWDLTGALPGDHLSLLETQSTAGTWFAGTFPAATYAARLSETETLLGVFESSTPALSILGVVSPEDGLYKTELSYDVPVPVLQFPLAEGAAWSTDATATGLAQGIFVTYIEEYETTVDARGELLTPFATFDVLRVRVDLTRWIGAVPTTTRQYVFVTECFGSVATIVSQPNETEIEFTDAAEVRRLSP